MKSLLLLGITTLFLGQEVSYNFTGNYTRKDEVNLIVDVRNGYYWVTFAQKNVNGSSPCDISERAIVKNGMLRIQVRRAQKSISLTINKKYDDGNVQVIVQGLKKSDQAGLANFCGDGVSIVGNYREIEKNN